MDGERLLLGSIESSLRMVAPLLHRSTMDDCPYRGRQFSVGFGRDRRTTRAVFPSADRDQLHLELELSTTASLHETRSVSERVQKILESHPSILRVDWVLGRNAPSFYYNMIGTRKDTRILRKL